MKTTKQKSKLRRKCARCVDHEKDRNNEAGRDARTY